MFAPGEGGMVSLFGSRVEGSCRTKASIPHVSGQQLMPGLEDRLMGARAASTWGGLQSIWKQFIVFCQENLDGEDGGLEHEWKIMLFLQAKLEAKIITVQTAFKYSKQLRQISKQMKISFDDDAVKEFQAALKREGALKPEHQAIPAEREDVVRALGYLTEGEAVGMIIAWVTCSRVGEVRHILKEDMVNVRGDLWSVTFPYSKGDPFRLGTTIVAHFGEWADRVKHHVTKLNPSQGVSSLTTERAAAVLDRVRPGLTGHSIKRGALTTLLKAGVPMSILQILAKHKDLETLLHYLPRTEVALGLGMHEATRALSGL